MRQLHEDPIGERLDEYFAWRGDWCNELSGQLQENGNDAFREVSPEKVVCIPAEMATEDKLTLTLEVLGRCAKRDATPTAFAMSANSVEGEQRTNDMIEHLSEVIRLQKSYPSFPLSYFVTEYPAGTPIGDIREHNIAAPARAVQLRCQRQGRPMPDLLMVSWDADTIDCTPTYLRSMQAAYNKRHASVKAWIGGASSTHDRLDPERFPNANRLLGWIDFASNCSWDISPAHFAVNIGGFALGRGFGGASLGEHGVLRKRIGERVLPEEFASEYIYEENTVRSARRLVSKMSQEQHAIYESLKSGSEPHQRLEQDVRAEYFNRQVIFYIQAAFGKVLNQELVLANIYDTQDSNNREEVNNAFLLASLKIMETAEMIGYVHATAHIVQRILEDFKNTLNLQLPKEG